MTDDMNDDNPNKAIKWLIGLSIVVVVVALILFFVIANNATNIKSNDIDQAPPQDRTSQTDNPDPVKQDTGNNGDTSQTNTGNGHTLQSSQ